MISRSLVIATRNRAEQLAVGLASIKEQDYRDLDTVLIDDGSTDGTAWVINEHQNWLRVFGSDNGHKYLSNPGSVLNRGHALAAGEVQLEQGGEVCHLTNCADILTLACRPGVVAVATVYNGDTEDYRTIKHEIAHGSYMFGDDTELGAPMETNGDRLPIPKVAIGGRLIQVYSGCLRPAPFLFLGAIHRRDREAVGGYDETIPVGNDEDFANRLLARGVRFRFVAKAVAVHLRHDKR